MRKYSDFTGLYPLSKTLRFELIPVGKTKENIEKNGILERDNKRAIGYKAIKNVIDEYHKAFIELMLDNFELNLTDNGKKDSLEEYYLLYHLSSTDPKKKVDMPKVQEALRKQISERFTKEKDENEKIIENTAYKRLFGMELIREDLVKEFVNTQKGIDYIRAQKGNENLSDEDVLQKREELVAEIAQFKEFTGYFDGLKKNRKNMYVADDEATSIAHRIISENLPKFIDNMNAFERIAASEVASHFENLYERIVLLCKEKKIVWNINSIEEIFKLNHFSKVLTQKQIDVYNAIIGGMVLDDGTKIQGINEYVNLYNQPQKDKSQKLPKLKSLFKQILSERNAISWLPDEFESDNDMLESIEKFYQDLKNKVFEGKDSLKALLMGIGEYDLEHVFLPDDTLNYISKKHYGDLFMIKNAFEEDVESTSQESFSLAQINRKMKVYLDKEYKPIESYFVGMGAEDNGDKQKPNHFIRIENAYTEVKSLLTTAYPEKRILSQDKANVEKIKNLLDAIKDLQHFVKPLFGKGTESEKDPNFYGEFIPLWETLDQITPLFDMVRNRMTKKVCSDEKIRLYFENNGSFLSGWVDSKTESDNATQYGGYLFRKQNSIGEYDYYLGVSSATKLFRSFNPVTEEDMSSFERLDYYQLKGKTFYGSLYKGNYEQESSNIKHALDVFVSKHGSASVKQKINAEKGKKQPKVSTAIGYLKFIEKLDIKLYNSLLKDDIFEKSNQAIMDSIQATLESLDRIPEAREYAEKQYSWFSEMMDDVEKLLQGKVFSYFPISQKELDEAVSRTERPLYLFKITNKDLSYAENHEKGLRKSRGTDNLHTMYFKALMSGGQDIFDIGSGSVYFREKKIDYTEEQLKKGHHYEMLKDKFAYPIISNKRYAYDKFQFHLSINVNYKAKNKDINPLVNAYLKESKATHIIGIDRGERHLLYLSLIDLQGNIVEQYSLNEIVNEYKGNTYRTNYHDLLDAKERQRDEARKSWQTIENIKELKEGYMSQVIHKIAELMVKYNAIVVLEDLNAGFMRGRQKVEKQVYQKFEKMLIDKLNYLVDKKLEAVEAGGVLKAYQLANKFESFQKLGKQSGFLFYVPAWNTSKMDPITGFVNLLDTRYENMAKAKVFFGKFKSIRHNDKKDWFEFCFDYNDFTTKATDTKTKWTLCTYGTRIETKRDPLQNNNFVSEEFDLTNRFKDLFTKYAIDLKGNLMEQICSQKDATFFKELLHLLHLTLQMRNSETRTENDYLISPVMNDNGEFYDSRKCGKNLPMNADANGAYNIARKGLWIIEQINQTEDLSKLKLAISNKEWMRYAQGLE